MECRIGVPCVLGMAIALEYPTCRGVVLMEVYYSSLLDRMRTEIAIHLKIIINSWLEVQVFLPYLEPVAVLRILCRTQNSKTAFDHYCNSKQPNINSLLDRILFFLLGNLWYYLSIYRL